MVRVPSRRRTPSPPPERPGGLRRHRWTAAGAVGLLALTLSLTLGLTLALPLALPPGLPTVAAWGADQDDLKHRRSQVTGRLQDARGDLGHSTHRLQRAARRLDAAQGRLSEAQAHLRSTRRQLAKAIALDRRMQRKLDAAKARLARARAELRQGRAEVRSQRSHLAAFAAESFQSGDNRFLELRIFLNAQSPENLTTQMNAVDSISTKQSSSFARLEASEVLLTVNEQEVEAAKKEVAAKRAAAARNLDRKERLEAEAEAAEAEVSRLVAARRDARHEAQAAKQEDLAQIRELEAQRAEIQERLEELARQRRAALARARERAQERAEERAEERSQERTQAAAEPSRSVVRSAGALIYPVNSYITSSYGMRYHPTLHYTKLHDGTDFGAACGTPIKASASGQVLSASYAGGYGNQVLVDHGIARGVSLSTSYSHLTSFAVSSGEHVSQGEIIGYAGTTGYSTGCHLHFMVYENGGTVDPMSWL